MQPARVLVCGSNYGAAYVRAIGERRAVLQLAGLLARGSRRSRQLAEACGVPLYTAVADVPADVDLACAAMGTEAFDVVCALLERGASVLLEYPVRADDLARARAIAEAAGVHVHVQTLFAAMPAAHALIEVCRRRLEWERPILIDLLATDRSLYAALDIVRRALGPLRGDEFVIGPRHRPFVTVNGRLHDVPITLRVQVSRLEDGRTLRDGAAEYLVDCRLGVWFADGVLTLLSVGGPVIWNERYRRQAEPSRAHWLPEHAAPTTFADLLKQQIRANADAMESLAAHAAGGAEPEAQRLEHVMDVARTWEQLARLIGGHQQRPAGDHGGASGDG